MKEKIRTKLNKCSLRLMLILCAIIVLVGACMLIWHGDNNLDSFSETVISLPDGWTMTDSAGNTQKVSLPLTVPYGKDGVYILSCTLPEDIELLKTPTFMFYSNYVDFRVTLDGEEIYAFPQSDAVFAGATGNTYHHLRLPTDYKGRTLSVTLCGQLGGQITYLLEPPLLGSKATMLNGYIKESLPFMILSACLFVFSLALGIMHFCFRKRLALDTATFYTSIFALLFSVYIFCETTYCKVIFPNGAFLCFLTLILLAALPIPLIGAFSENISTKYFAVPLAFMALHVLNLLAQIMLNVSGVCSVRAMLPATHLCIILSVVVIVPFFFLSDRKEKPNARRNLLVAIPMLAGGMMDILLIWTESPSFNNSFWFILGVSSYIIIQFSLFCRNFFTIYRNSLQSEFYKSMAYCDILTGLGNRNAYEHRIEELNGAQSLRGLCCIVQDINNLKFINDTKGHSAGDDAIAAVSRLLLKHVPSSGACFRTGGDEFLVLLEDCSLAKAEKLAGLIAQDALSLSLPLSLAYGVGEYEPADEGINGFVRRVDTLMYECKRLFKEKEDCKKGNPQV